MHRDTGTIALGYLPPGVIEMLNTNKPVTYAVLEQVVSYELGQDFIERTEVQNAKAIVQGQIFDPDFTVALLMMDLLSRLTIRRNDLMNIMRTLTPQAKMLVYPHLFLLLDQTSTPEVDYGVLVEM